MAEILGDIMAPNGKYVKDGQEKTRWLKCGILLQTDNGMRLKLECIPIGVGPEGLWMSVFEKERQTPRPAQTTAPAPSQAAPAKEPDVPF